MGPISDDGEADDDEATTFNARAHHHFLKDIFTFFQVDFDTWCIALICDNDSVNVRLAKDCMKSLVECSNHKLQLDFNTMIREHAPFNEAIELVHSIMMQVRTLKNAAVLRNLTALSQLFLTKRGGLEN